MNNRKKSFFIILFVPLLILLLMAVKPAVAYLFGEKIVLESLPVDPRDLFYGDYINVNLAITEVPIEKADEALRQKLKEFENGNRQSALTVYTTLQKEGEIYTAKEVRLTKPESSLYMKGKIYYYSFYDDYPLRIDYQLDRFYVEENTGKEIEKMAQEGKVLIGVKLMDGYALFDDLIVP